MGYFTQLHNIFTNFLLNMFVYVDKFQIYWVYALVLHCDFYIENQSMTAMFKANNFSLES